MAQELLFQGGVNPRNRELRRQLQAINGLAPSLETESSTFDANVEAAVRRFQQAAVALGLKDAQGNPIMVDGVCGPQVLGLIERYNENNAVRVGMNALLNPSAMVTTVIPQPAMPSVVRLSAERFVDVSLEAPVPSETRADEAVQASSVSRIPIESADLLSRENYARAWRQSGLSEEEFNDRLAQLATDLNSLPNATQTAALARSIANMYNNGYPVEFRPENRNESGAIHSDSSHYRLDADLVPMRTDDVGYNTRQMNYISGAMRRNGLVVTSRGQNGFQVSQQSFSSLEEMKEAIEEENGTARVLPTAPFAGEIRITSEQGNRVHPISGRINSQHAGLDMATTTPGTMADILSTMPGKVVFAGRMGGYGNTIEVEDIYGIVHRYGHLNSIDVRRGQIVQQGEPIGVMGSTGLSDGVHLHYEQRQRGFLGFTSPMRINTDFQPVEEAVVASPRPVREAASQFLGAQRERVAREAAEIRARAEAAASTVTRNIQRAADVVGDVVGSVFGGLFGGRRNESRNV